MATIYTYKEAMVSDTGMWVKSVDGGPEIYLDRAQALKLAEQIIMARPALTLQRSAQPAQRTVPTVRRSAPTATQRSAVPTVRRSAPVAQLTSKTFTGKSSCTDPKWLDHSKALAKTRAEKALKSYLDRLTAEGKGYDCRSRGGYSVNGANVYYIITLESR